MKCLGPAVLILAGAACSDYYPVKITPPPATYDTTAATIANNTAAQWTAEHAWRVDTLPAITISAPQDQPDNYARQPVSVLRNARGELIVADAAAPRLHIYARNGTFVRTIDACELQRVRWIEPYRGDSIAVYGGDMTVAILAAAGACGRTVRLARPASTPEHMVGDTLWDPDIVLPYPDGSFAASSWGTVIEPDQRGSTWYTTALLRFDADGALLDTLAVLPGAEVHWLKGRARPLEFGRRLYAAIDGFDIVAGESSWFRIIRMDTTGTVRLIAQRHHYVERVFHEDRIAVVRAANPTESDTMALLKARKWPDRMPAFSGLLTDPDGNAWLEEYRYHAGDSVVEDAPTVFWSVFDRKGVWLGQVEMPGAFRLLRVYDDMLFGAWYDLNGTASVRGYRLTKPDVPDDEYQAVPLRQGVR